MRSTPYSQDHAGGPPRLVKVWDLPTRLFHWLLVACVITSFTSGRIGGNAMRIHELSGFVILGLLFFRLAWGFVGSYTARFVTFIHGPVSVFNYAAGLLRGNSPRYLGHNPLGGWSIAAMLLALSIQVAAGLFANDDIATQGPLYVKVSKATSDWLTQVHLLNRWVIAILVGVHLSAIAFYLFFKHENLITPMFTGVKQWKADARGLAAGRPAAAMLIAGLAGLAVYLIVR
jgi:cytochrome b